MKLNILPFRYLLFIFIFYFCTFFSIFPYDFVKVEVEKLDGGGGFQFYATNNLEHSESWLNIKLENLVNIKPNEEFSEKIVLPPKAQKQKIALLKPIEKLGYSMHYKYNAGPGNPNTAKHSGKAYLFPFEHGQKFKISQGFNGEFTHKDWQSYAIDFQMPEGTPVHSAREGKVILTISHNNIGGPTEKYAEYGNRILILHDDGTIASYFHLKKNGVAVEEGAVVEAGQLIGYSGNTGRTQGPHLHFDVIEPNFNGFKTVPVVMLNHENKETEPITGEYYYSYHPGKPDFPTEFGKDITPEKYNDYIEDSKLKEDLKIEVEKVDDTNIFFVSNGHNHKIDFSLQLKTNNCSASSGAFQVVVPAQKKVFLFLLKPTNPAKAWSYSYRTQYKKAMEE